MVLRVWKSNHYDIWPLYVSICELPQHERYLAKDIMLAGLFQGSKKPYMLTFLKPFYEELKKLEQGVMISTIEGEKRVKAYLITGTYDFAS